MIQRTVVAGTVNETKEEAAERARIVAHNREEMLSLAMKQAEYWRESTIIARCEAARWRKRHDDLKSRYDALWCVVLIVGGALAMAAMGAC